MLKNNVRYIEREKEETINPNELPFEKLEDLSMKKITTAKKLEGNVQVHCDSSNLIFQRGIKEC